jgi:hypothetical protein
MTDMTDMGGMTNATPTHGDDAGGEQTALRDRIQALGDDAIIEISRGANIRCARIRSFRDGQVSLDLNKTKALSSSVAAVEAAHTAADGKIVQFPIASGDETQKTKVKKAKTATTPDAISTAPEATATQETDDSPPAGAPAPEAIRAAPETTAPDAENSAPIGERGIDELSARAARLAPGDIAGARAIIEAAVILPPDGLEKDRLLDALKKALKNVRIDTIRAAWISAAAKLRPSPEDMAAADAAVRAAEKEAERARLGPLVKDLAIRPDLIEHAAGIVQALGVVGEQRAIKANYIAMSSRTLDENRVLSIVITGLSSAGKSHLMNTVAKIFPPEFIEVITSGSPKSLVFMVRDDPHALSHKIILLGETAGFIAGSDTEFNPSAAMVRDLLTDGVINYGISEKGDDGQFVTQKIKVYGPISLATTTARANLDPEMENRLLEVPIDESLRATAAIQHAQLSGETRRRAKAAAPEVEKLIEFQRWLQLEEGMRVVIPDDLLEAIDAAGGIPVTVQTRRDVPLFLLAVKTCAAIHRARRKQTDEGEVIAEFEDYEVAHDAIDGFMAATYSTSLKPPEIAVLAAIEALIVEDQKRRKGAAKATAGKPETVGFDGLSITDMKARFTYDALAAQAQIKSRQTLSKRVKALKRAKAIEVTVEHSGYGTKASIWELLIPAAQAATAAKYGRFMPDPMNVYELLIDRVTRQKRLNQILAENGTLPDWRDDDAGGGQENADSAEGPRSNDDNDSAGDGDEKV